MKFIIKKLLPVFVLCALTSVAAATETAIAPQTVPAADATAPATPSEPPKARQLMRVGYVDINRISNESNLGKTSQTQAKDKQQKLKTQIESRKKQLDKQKNAIQGKLASLTPNQREAKAKEFQKRIEEFQNFGLNAEKELQSLQDNLAKKLFETVEQASVEYGKANGLALIIVKQELLYLSGGVDALDVSDGIIKILNEKGAKK